MWKVITYIYSNDNAAYPLLLLALVLQLPYS